MEIQVILSLRYLLPVSDSTCPTTRHDFCQSCALHVPVV